jgi:hypothetical protein
MYIHEYLQLYALLYVCPSMCIYPAMYMHRNAFINFFMAEDLEIDLAPLPGSPHPGQARRCQQSHSMCGTIVKTHSISSAH